MKRKDAIVRIAAAGFGVGASSALIVAASNRPMRSGAPAAQRGKPLSPPKSGPVKVALVIGPDLVAIDIFGPYAAFRAASLAHDTTSSPLFEFYMLAKTTDSIDVDGLQLRPHYSFDDAPQPHVVVVPNQLGSDETVAYVKGVFIDLQAPDKNGRVVGETVSKWKNVGSKAQDLGKNLERQVNSWLRRFPRLFPWFARRVPWRRDG